MSVILMGCCLAVQKASNLADLMDDLMDMYQVVELDQTTEKARVVLMVAQSASKMGAC